MKEAECLGVMFSKDGSGKADVENTVTRGRRVGGAPRTLVNGRKLSLERAGVLDGEAVVFILYSYTVWLSEFSFLRFREIKDENIREE